MENSAAEFQRIVQTIVGRFCAQVSAATTSTMTAAAAGAAHGAETEVDVKAAPVQRLAAQLLELVVERRDVEAGAPGEMSESERTPLVARAMAGVNDPVLAKAAEQLVKACFYPEMPVCRDSYREVGRDGACRRQELERARGRISGAHCVDCPHWLALGPAEHGELLAREWRGDPAVFAAHRETFLPEDFRALRRWLRDAAQAKRAR